jgi:hypothetical protein
VSDVVVSAIVAGAVSLVVTFGKIAWDGRQRKQERQLAAREKLDRYREPLLTAADGLGSRVNNIRNDGFLSYLGVPERQRTAMLGTLFRFAQLFGWTEILYGSFDRLRFERDTSTKAVADALRDIGRLLAVDRVDRTDPADATTTRLMIWREEQRAIGELMRVDGDPPRCSASTRSPGSTTSVSRRGSRRSPRSWIRHRPRRANGWPSSSDCSPAWSASSTSI